MANDRLLMKCNECQKDIILAAYFVSFASHPTMPDVLDLFIREHISNCLDPWFERVKHDSFFDMGLHPLFRIVNENAENNPVIDHLTTIVIKFEASNGEALDDFMLLLNTIAPYMMDNVVIVKDKRSDE